MAESTPNIDKSDVSAVLNHFKVYSYEAVDSLKDPFLQMCMKNCKQLFLKDYKLLVVDNERGELCSHYPSEILIPTESVTGVSAEVLSRQLALSDRVVECVPQLFQRARFARCRGRFVVPAILYEDKWVCRASALASSPEMYGRVGLDMLFTGSGHTTPTAGQSTSGGGQSTSTVGQSISTCGQSTFTDAQSTPTSAPVSCVDGMDEAPSADPITVTQPSSRTTPGLDRQLVEGKRKVDLELLDTLKVSTICDLMVEHKRGMYGVYFVSSEKADKEKRYRHLDILVMPYSGCEFFSQYGQCAYRENLMMSDWERAGVDAEFALPQSVEIACAGLGIDWAQYKMWDLATLTENYMLILLTHMCRGEGGLLVHCISGWDRTPLFVALLRLSLWADGRIHTSLSALEMVYLTLTYDWLLFGHHFPDRLSRAEEILFFGYNFLKHFGHRKFSVDFLLGKCSEEYNNSGGAESEPLESERMTRLREVREIFIGAYGSTIGFHFGEGIGERKSMLMKTFNKIVNKFDIWSGSKGSPI